MNETAQSLVASMRLRADGLVPVVNSRDVAEMFEKRHADVLRSIGDLELNAELRSAWFRPVSYLAADGTNRPAFDLTRDGFTLLVMGWTGERAMQFKVQYIQAFNVMEAELRQPTGAMTTHDMLAAVREIVGPLAVRFDGQDRALERVENRVDVLAEDMAHVKSALLQRRRNLNEATKRDHVADVRIFGGRCPCCGQADVLDADGARSKFAEFDHFYASCQPDAASTWLICKPCHSGLTTGRIPRDRREAQFRAYQENRRQLPGRQANLFGG